MKTHRLKWMYYAPHGEVFRVARHHFLPSRPWFLHRHDYAEVGWIESGKGEHLVNGGRVPLVPGTLFMVRPDDTHEIRAGAPDGLVFVNVSFPVKAVNELRERYFPGEPAFWGGKSTQPVHHQLTAQQVQQLAVRVTALVRSPCDRVHLDSFLLGMICDFLLPHAGNRLTDLPPWLAVAITQFQDPESLSGGLKTFFRLCGRCPAHVSRAVKRYLHKTPTDLVNEARISQVAEQLALSTDSIVQIMQNCGFSSPAYFYKLFSARYHMTPRQYRLHQRASMGSHPPETVDT